MKKAILTALAALTLSLTACGGGTNTSTHPNPDPIPVGWGDPPTITAAQLKSCPLANTLEQGKIDPAVALCVKGTINGVTQAGGSQKCSLTIDASGSLTFSSPVLTKSITLKPTTYVPYVHRIDNGAHTVMYGLQDRATDTAGKVDIGFAYYESITNTSLQNLSITVQDGQQNAVCMTRL